MWPGNIHRKFSSVISGRPDGSLRFVLDPLPSPTGGLENPSAHYRPLFRCPLSEMTHSECYPCPTFDGTDVPSYPTF